MSEPDQLDIACPVCGRLVFAEGDDYCLCPECDWENDGVQRRDPDYWGGANDLSVNESRVRYRLSLDENVAQAADELERTHRRLAAAIYDKHAGTGWSEAQRQELTSEHDRYARELWALSAAASAAEADLPPVDDPLKETAVRILPGYDPVTDGNSAGFTVRWRLDSPVIIHVPHAGLAWPDDDTAVPDYEPVASEAVGMADLRIDRVADMVDALLAEAGRPEPNRFQSRLSRLAMDPERFDDETEEMNSVGMGVVYERASGGQPLYSAGLSAADATRRKQLWYQPYAAAFSSLVDDVIAAHSRCLIIDLHSYSVDPLPYELHKLAARPSICLGYTMFHDPGVEVAEKVLNDHGFDTARNQPFAGAYVPLSRLDTDPSVTSLMIDVRKDQYLDGTQVNNALALRLAEAIQDVIVQLGG